MHDWQSLAHVRWECKYHVVIIPKFRRKILYGQLRKQVGRILRALCDQRGVELLEGKAMADHVHLCLSIPPKYSVAHTVGFLKGKSAVQIHRKLLRERRMTGLHFWSTGYCVSTVGLDEGRIREYIREPTRERSRDEQCPTIGQEAQEKVTRWARVDVIDREEYAELEVDAKVELIRSLVPLGLMHIEEWLDEEVTALAGERDARKAPSVGGRRHGSNPGTVGLAGQRVPIRVPRIRHVTESEIPRRSYEALHGDRAVNDLWLRRVLYGISCRNDAAAAEAIPRAIGLSGSTVSRAFIQASATKLRELQERDLSGEDVVALVLDGKTFAEATMVVALGITMTGDKRFLGVVETDTENEKVLTPFLRSLVERGLDVSQGLLVIVDGGKGLRAAVRKAFRHRALVHRCQWHTRENVVSYVAKREQPVWRQRLQRADNRPEYDEALAALTSLQHELEDRNQSAAGSLAEGLDETLTLHRLGVYGVLGRSLKTTNGLEAINALIEERCAKVDHWQNSSQRHRWLATALLDIEPRLRKVMGYRHLPRLRDALKRELKIDTTTSTKKAA